MDVKAGQPTYPVGQLENLALRIGFRFNRPGDLRGAGDAGTGGFWNVDERYARLSEAAITYNCGAGTLQDR